MSSRRQVLRKRRLVRLSRKDDISSTFVSVNTTHVDFRSVSYCYPSDNSSRWPFCCHYCKCGHAHTHTHARVHAHAVPSRRSRCGLWAWGVRTWDASLSVRRKLRSARVVSSLGSGRHSLVTDLASNGKVNRVPQRGRKMQKSLNLI